MTEPTLSPQDQADLDSLGIQLEEAPEERTLLSVWSSVLDNIDASAEEPISIHVASRVIASWPFLTFQETALYHAVYHQILSELREELRQLIKAHPDALGWTGEDDGRENHDLYRELLVTWHRSLDDYETDWRAETPDSHVWVAAIADARAFFFSQVGLAGHLDAIGFSMTDGEFLEAVKEAEGE